MSEIITAGPLKFSEPNCPTRVGEIVENIEDIYSIPTPRLGMQVFVKSEKKSFVITKLKSKVIGGVDVPEAAVEAFEAVGAKSITWNNDTEPSNMNDFVVAGVYDIKGEHTRTDDNLPILNTGGGHTFNARLTVLDSSIIGSGENDDKCITQVFSFSNRLGQGEVYIRTGKGNSLDNLAWENWNTLQRNVNVGQISSLDNLKDNGIYSGVWMTGHYNNYPLTFVCIVINDYFIDIAPRRISQFVYGLSKFDGSVVYQSRVWDDSKDKWGDWEILNKNEITSMISAEVKKVTDGIDPNKIDSIKDIITWIDAHGGDVQAIYNAIQGNSIKINAEINRAKQAEEELRDAIRLNYEDIKSLNTNKAERSVAMQYDTLGVNTYADKAEIYGRSITGTPRTFNFPAATAERAGVMSAADKVVLDDCKMNAVQADTIEATGLEDIVKVDYSTIGGKADYSFGILAATTETAGVMSAEDKREQVKKTPLANGDIIVGQAREIHSRNGKNVTDSFLARTTAGSGTIGDGVASLKSVGGNIVKNLISQTTVTATNSTKIDSGNISIFQRKGNDGFGFTIKTNKVVGHKYYFKCFTLTPIRDEVVFYLDGIALQYLTKGGNSWIFNSVILTCQNATGNTSFNFGEPGSYKNSYAALSSLLLIDLTEMFGAGNEPDKATCDKLFGTMDALPQGLSIANPTAFTSIGFNHFNPDNVLEGKAVVDNAIVSGDKKIAVIPCLPCKVGTGENNGYCIHGDFGDDIKVYLTPINPMEVEGELYMHELTKDATTDTYVPQIKGYMLVEVPTTANLCAHFLWSEDKCERDTYEPYFESKVELPVIPQMSEWGLAGIQSSGTLAADTIDFERGVYVKRIGSVDLGSLPFTYYKSGDGTAGFKTEFSTVDYGFDKTGNLVCAKFGLSPKTSIFDSTWFDESIMYYHPNIYIRADDYTTAASFKAAMQGVMLYYELAEPEEYPLPKVDNNYISSDYGVEQFDSNIPCNANNLYYMRSLAGETRNFLDKLYNNTDKTDAKEVADYITSGIEGNKELVTGKKEKVKIVQPSDFQATIDPNIFYLWGTASTLEVELGDSLDGEVSEYMFQFTSGATATTLVLPADIKWVSAPNIQANKTYQVSIINNLGVIGEFSHE